MNNVHLGAEGRAIRAVLARREGFVHRARPLDARPRWRYIRAVAPRPSPVLAGVCVALLALTAVGCDSAEEIRDRTVEVGCGMCRFHRLRDDGKCYWAADFDGNVVPVQGDVVPDEANNHAPDGMCNVTRDAIVSGTLYPTYFLATRFELQPVAPAATPAFTPADEH